MSIERSCRHFLTKGRPGSSTKTATTTPPVHIVPQQVIEAMRSRRWGGEPKKGDRHSQKSETTLAANPPGRRARQSFEREAHIDVGSHSGTLERHQERPRRRVRDVIMTSGRMVD